MKIVYKDKDVVVINKDAGMPVQSDKSGDADAMTLLSEELKAICEPSALWLVHRLDRVVGGAVAFARNKKYAQILSELVSGDGMIKEYFAIVEGSAEGGEMRDLLYKDSAKGKSFVVDRKRNGVKEAFLEYTHLESAETERGIYSLVKVRLHTGRFHQIRAQFSSRRMPIVGDGKYGSHDNKAKLPALFSARVAFTVGNKRVDAKALPDVSSYPWSLFSESSFNK